MSRPAFAGLGAVALAECPAPEQPRWDEPEGGVWLGQWHSNVWPYEADLWYCATDPYADLGYVLGPVAVFWNQPVAEKAQMHLRFFDEEEMVTGYECNDQPIWDVWRAIIQRVEARGLPLG